MQLQEYSVLWTWKYIWRPNKNFEHSCILQYFSLKQLQESSCVKRYERIRQSTKEIENLTKHIGIMWPNWVGCSEKDNVHIKFYQSYILNSLWNFQNIFFICCGNFLKLLYNNLNFESVQGWVPYLNIICRDRTWNVLFLYFKDFTLLKVKLDIH